MIFKYKVCVALVVVLSICVNIEGRSVSKFLTEETVGTKWAVLVAGSNGWWNYRHQVISYKRFNNELRNVVLELSDDLL